MTVSRIVTFLRFDYLAVSPFAVACPDPGGPIDLPLSADADRIPWIPPSAVAGSLRSHLRTVLEPDPLVELMGSDPGNGEDGQLVRSRLSVDGTTLERAEVVQRTQTAIDRSTGSARPGTLRDAEVLDTGACLRVYMTVEGELSDGERDALAEWQPAIGRARSRGMGRFEQTDLKIGQLDLGDRRHLLQWLTRGGPSLHDRVATETLSRRNGTETKHFLSMRMRVSDGLFTFKSRDSNVGISNTSIPGSTLKGIFRSRLEFILRSVGEDACEDGQCGQCTTCEVFGYANKDDAQRSQLAFRDAPILVDGDALEEADLELRTHVAIDRVTGGASHRRLFVECFVPHGATFDVVIDSLIDEPKPWVRELLLWVIKDVHDGYVGIGGRTTRGYGTVEVVENPGVSEYVVPALLEGLRAVKDIVVNVDVAEGATDE